MILFVVYIYSKLFIYCVHLVSTPATNMYNLETETLYEISHGAVNNLKKNLKLSHMLQFT